MPVLGTPISSASTPRERAAEIVRGAAFGVLVAVMVVAGWATAAYLLIWLIFATLIMLRKLAARIIAGIFAFAALLLNIQEHRAGIAVIFTLQLVVLAIPNRLLRFAFLER